MYLMAAVWRYHAWHGMTAWHDTILGKACDIRCWMIGLLLLSSLAVVLRLISLDMAGMM